MIETKTKIPSVKTGTDFLASSHFQIGKEPQWLIHKDPQAYKSTFQEDYPPRISERIGLANIPPPALMMHKDHSNRVKCSISREQFVPYPRDVTPTSKSLTKTNFKMDRDDRINTFLTTHDHYYRPPMTSNSSRLQSNFSQMESHIPQGDVKKERPPESDYKNNFTSKLLTRRREIINDTFVGPNIIKGDVRSHGCTGMFNTTSRRDFPAHKNHRKALVPDSVQYPKTRIPCGANICHESSTHQVSFKGKYPSISPKFDRNKALSDLQKTTFKNGDVRMECFRTTADECYKYNTPFDNSPRVMLDMGKSSFPEGDRDPVRSAERISETINHADYRPPPDDYHNRIVDGSALFNVSSVSFGNDKDLHYNTTMESNFPIKACRFEKHNTDSNQSSIPLKYYGNLPSNSSYRIDYLPTKTVKKLAINKMALDNLRQSHIVAPIQGIREFSTTHSDTYTVKKIPRALDLNIGSLQKSSLPIGTLGKSRC